MIFVQDSFTDIDFTLLQNHTPDIGGTWSRISGVGTMFIEGNQLDAGSFFCIYENSTIAQFDSIDITFRWVSFVGGPIGGAVGRLINVNNHYRCVYDTDRYILQRVLNGVVTTLSDLVEAVPTLPALITFELRTIGTNRLRLLVDNIEKLVSADETFTQPGKIGLVRSGNLLDDLVAVASPEVAVQLDFSPNRPQSRILAY